MVSSSESTRPEWAASSPSNSSPASLRDAFVSDDTHPSKAHNGLRYSGCLGNLQPQQLGQACSQWLKRSLQRERIRGRNSPTGLVNPNSQADWAPDVNRARILKRQGQQVELEQIYQAGYTFGLPIKARLAITEQPISGFSYRLIQGDRLNRLQGSWSITPVTGGVRLLHKINVDPQVPAPLRAIYYDQQESNLLEWMRILKQRMEAR